MTVRNGINPSTWTFDDVPELHHFTSMKDCWHQAAESGHAGIEIGGIFPRTATELRPFRSGMILNAKYRKAS